MKSLAFLFLISPLYSIFAQENDSISKSPLQVTASVQIGKFLPTNDYLKTLEQKNFISQSAEVTVQTDGSQEWHKRFGRPYYGGGIMTMQFPSHPDFGKPIIIYGTFGGTIKEGINHSWNYETSGGFAFNWNPFDYEGGNHNPSLGSSVSVYVNFGASYKYYLGKHFDLGLGFNFNHYSNGALKFPNKGLNTISPKLSLTYHLNERKVTLKEEIESAYEKKSTLDISAYGGVRHSVLLGKDDGFEYEDVNLEEKYKGIKTHLLGIEGVYHRQVSYKSSLGLGIGVLYDGDYNNKFYMIEDGSVRNEKRFQKDNLLMTIFPSYRLTISKFEIHVQPGFYLFKKAIERRYDKTFFYQRLIFQYNLGNNWLIGIGLKASQFHKADFIEWRLGYRVFNRKSI